MRFQASAIDHVDRVLEQSSDIFLDAYIVVDGYAGGRVKIDDHIDVAVSTLVPSRGRAEDAGMNDAFGAKFRFGLAKCEPLGLDLKLSHRIKRRDVLPHSCRLQLQG